MGILNPLALAYLPLIGLLVLIYFFRKKRRTIPVPSFIPWRVLKQDTIRTRLFLADALFILQLIALLLLIFFLTRPYIPSITSGVIGKNMIILIDTSASMQALEGGRTRFQKAREEALKLVDKMGISDSMQIITTGAKPHILNEPSDNKAKLRELIRGIRPLDTGTNLEEGISLGVSLLRHTGRGELHVLTDKTAPDNLQSNVRFVNLSGPGGGNVAITGLNVYQDMFKEYREREAYVTLKNFSDESKTILLRSYLNQKPLADQVVELFPGEDSTVSIQKIMGPGLLKVELSPDDALAVDNRAYAIIKHKKTFRVLVVTEELLLIDELRKIERAARQLSITVIPPASYTPETVKNYDMTIFHQYVPEKYPDANTLFIFPPANNRYFPVKGWTRGASIIDWDDSHPIMRHLDYMEEIWIYKALHLEPAEDLKTVITAAGPEEDFPLALAGNFKNKKVVVLGLDIADFNLSKAKDMPILIMLLNIVQWLNPDSAESSQIKTGEPFIVTLGEQQKASDVTLLTPEGKTVSIKPAGGRLVITDTYLSGEYVLNIGKTRKRFVANMFDAKESNLRPSVSHREPVNFKEASASTYVKEEKVELGRYILAFAALMLFAEWVVYCIKAHAAVT